MRALNTLIAAAEKADARQELRTDLEPILGPASKESSVFRGQVLAALGRLRYPPAPVAEAILRLYPKMEPELKPKAIELLTQAASWARVLLNRSSKKHSRRRHQRESG